MKAVRLLSEKSSDGRSKAAYKKWVVKDVDNVGTILTLWEPFKDKVNENDVFSLDHFKVTCKLISVFFPYSYCQQQQQHPLTELTHIILFIFHSDDIN